MELEGGRFFRSSTRSKGSSSASDVDPREKVKDCCRKLVAFMCTQVGVGGLVVGYTIVGAFAFRRIEKEAYAQYDEVEQFREECLCKLWNIAQTVNILNESVFRIRMEKALLDYQENIVTPLKEGYNGKPPDEVWSFPAALMFSLSIITMIGYGNMTPKTNWGKSLTVVYAIFGIPLYILYFMNMGEVLAGCFRWGYTWLHECTTERRREEEEEDVAPRRIVVPSSACLWVIGGYVFTGVIMFAHWENWGYLDSAYFCVTSLCKIGFGDLVPGANIKDSAGGSQTKLVINFVYMLVGLGLVAMCYNLMREEIRVKVKELQEDMNQCLEDTRARFATCCQRCSCRNY